MAQATGRSDGQNRSTKRPDRDSGSEFVRLASWLDEHADTLLDDPDNNLIGIGIGKKSAGPIDDDAPFCITGFVEKKLPVRQITARGLASFAEAAAAVTERSRSGAIDFVIDVVETGSRFQAQPGLRADSAYRGVHGGLPPTLDLQKRFQTLRSGIGITNPHRAFPNSLSVGTLGFFVRDDQGHTYLVSNNHVIADENNGKTGDAVVQPGTLDLTSSEMSLMNTLAKLKRELAIAQLSAWIELKFHEATGIPFNLVDCAAAELTASGRDLGEIGRIGLGAGLAGVAAPFTVDAGTGKVTGPTRVYKAGRTTGWTEGEVTQIAVVTDVRYGKGLARFRNQLGIGASADNGGPFSKPGDSGSGIVDRNQNLVGLLFAGSDTRTLANPIQSVLDELRTALKVATLTVVT